MKVKLTSSKLILNGPDYDAFLHQRWQTAVLLGGSVLTSGGVSVLGISDDNAGLVTLEDIRAVVDAGGEVEGMPGFLTIAASVLGNNVCEGIPNRMKDENTVRTWGEYHNSVNEARVDENTGLTWISTNPFGHRLKGSEIILCHDTHGVNFASVTDYKNAFPDGNQG